MPDELKPCPFCGSNNIGKYQYGIEQTIYIIACDDCPARVEDDYIGEEALIQAWNRRVQNGE